MHPSCTGRCPDLRCPHCPAPGTPPTPTAPILRRLQAPLFSCPCRNCGAAALVLASGADRPYAYCATCRSCAAAPARSRWRGPIGRGLSTAPPLTQLTLF